MVGWKLRGGLLVVGGYSCFGKNKYTSVAHNNLVSNWDLKVDGGT